MTLRQIVYMCLDELKLYSDDANFNEEHIIFLVDKYRAFLLKQRYSDIKKQIPSSNFQEICLDLEVTSDLSPCGGVLLRSIDTIPETMCIGSHSVYPIDYYQGTHISLISRERMRVVGYNKYLQNIIYCSKGTDGHLYFKSGNPQFVHLRKVKYRGIFEDIEAASRLSCNSSTDTKCDILDTEFPLESALVPPLLELVVKELTVAEYKPEDTANNATDDLANKVTNSSN